MQFTNTNRKLRMREKEEEKHRLRKEMKIDAVVVLFCLHLAFSSHNHQEIKY